MKSRALLALAVMALAACTPRPAATPQPPTTSRPYLLPLTAVREELLTWTEPEVRACFGAPLDSDVVAGLPRYRFVRGACTAAIMFVDGKVHSVEGYGLQQECWWVIDACEDPSSPRPAEPVALATSWRSWSMDEVAACFGEPQVGTWSNQTRNLRTARDGCTIDMQLEQTHRLSMVQWEQTEPGACRRLLHKCDATLPTSQQ
jgi:hypothetical protein